MKIISKCLLVALGIITLSSCSDFLETNPSTQISVNEFYKTKDDMMKGLYAVMNEIQIRMPEVWSYSSLLSDESETGGGIGEGFYKTKWDTFTYNANSCFGAWGYGSWWNEWDFGLYNGVTAANLLIDNLDACDLDKSFVNELSAEAKFYRAFFYDYLFMGYEQFPLITHYLPVDSMYTVRKGTRDEIFNFMMSDLDDAVTQYLPLRSETQQGRVCRDAAKLLRTKIILFHRAEDKYPQALADMKEIISSGRYHLVPDYKSLWLKAGEWGPESIYEVAYAGNNSGEGFGLARSLGGRNIQDPRSAEQGGLMEGYGQNTMPSTIYKMFEDGDTRRDGTVINYADEAKKVEKLVANGELPEGSKFSISDQQENYEGLGHYKLHPRKESTTSPNPTDNYYNSWRIYRYADVLLLATELDVRINGQANQDDQNWLNQIRDRAFRDTNHRVNIIGKSKQEVLDILFNERRYEFTDEMQRWFDILRFDKGTEVLGNKGWTEKYRYFPIDQSEIDRSKNHLTQNPGWQ